MDPITAALVAAIAAGATEVGKTAVVDAYNGVKALIKRKFGQTALPEAIEYLEKKPESPTRQGSVTEEIASVNADNDSEILKEIEKLQEVIQQVPNAQEKLARYNLTIKNSKIGLIGDNATITGDINIS